MHPYSYQHAFECFYNPRTNILKACVERYTRLFPSCEIGLRARSSKFPVMSGRS